MSPMKNDEVLTTAEATTYLKVSKPTYVKCIRLGKIKAVKVGKGWRVLRSELHRFLTRAKKR
jgi:excisionase family DNA binding protein